MKEKILKVVTVILILFSMLFSNLCLIGASIVEAVEEATATTNTAKIEINAYFKENQNNVGEKSIDIENEETLYISVDVKDKASISNAIIKLENANFKISEDKKAQIELNRYVNSVNIDEQKIELTMVSSNTSFTIEVPVKFKKEEKIKEAYFSQDTTLKLEGKYIDAEAEKEKELYGETNVKVQWKKEEISSSLLQGISKFYSLGENGVIVEQDIQTEIANNVLPRKEEIIYTKVVELDGKKPFKINVICNNQKLEDNQIEYNQEKNLLIVKNVKTQNNEGKYFWGTQKNEYKVIYQYEKGVSVVNRNVALNTKAEIKLMTKEKSIEQEKTEEITMISQGNVATINTSIAGDLYKGFMYANSSKEISYEETNKIDVSNIDLIETVQINTNSDKFIIDTQEYNAEEFTKYVQTKINKEQMMNILGNEGSITIKNANDEIITNINSSTEADSEGNIVVNYNSDTKIIKFETTKPQREGCFEVKNIKAISGKTGIDINTLKQVNKIKAIGEVKTNVSQETSQAEIELKEPVTEGKIEANVQSLSTMKTNKNVEIKAVLKSNSSKYDLYKNPSIEIKMPEDVTDVEVTNINILYGDEFEVKPGLITDENGLKTISIKLIGEQTEYKEAGIDGATIIINANLTLNNKATSKESAFTMIYTNEKATSYSEQKETGVTDAKVEVVSPKGLITVNNIKSLGIETIGEEKGVEKEIEKSAEAKELEVTQEIINNNEEEIQNVQILGTYGTNGKVNINGETVESNVNQELTSGLNVITNDANKTKIYYTENENATADVNNLENGWKETITDATKTNKYLITLTNMAPKEGVKVSYTANIPENLEYNQDSYQTYETTYTESTTGIEQKVKATAIKLTTGQGPVVETTLTAKVGNEEIKNEDEIKEGEVIRYIATVKNTGNEIAKNITVTGQVPGGTVLVSTTEEQNYKATTYTEIPGSTQSFQISELGINETKEVEYLVRVNTNIIDGAIIKNKIEIAYGEVSKESNEITNILREAEFRIEVVRDQGFLNTVKQNETEPIVIYLTNLTNQKLRNITIDLSLPNEMSLPESNCLHIYDENNNEVSEEISNKITMDNEKKQITIEELSEASTLHICTVAMVSKNAEQEIMDVYAKGKINDNEVRSNLLRFHLVRLDKVNIKMTANKEDEYINPFEEIVYTIELENKNANTYTTQFLDRIPTKLIITKITINEQEKDLSQYVSNDNVVSIADVEIPSGEKIEIKIYTKVKAIVRIR